ncbi:MAG: hypothetical protein GEU88_12865 [Solirubrobacterales bacterium]|nr:hypothetical protein [Solirubrobacterales bacterium]
MDRYANPYNPGAGTQPAVLSGRETELERFDLLVGRLERGGNEKSLIVHGLRGVARPCCSTGWRAPPTSAAGSRSSPRSAARTTCDC